MRCSRPSISFISKSCLPSSLLLVAVASFALRTGAQNGPAPLPTGVRLAVVVTNRPGDGVTNIATPPTSTNRSIAKVIAATNKPASSEEKLRLDARPDKPPPPPLDKLALTQILDDRELKSGKLTLEIKASGNGLIPDLLEVLDPSLPGFKLDQTTDLGLTITKREAGDRLAPLAERNWLLNYVALGGGASPKSFQFPKAKLPISKAAFKRYADADLIDVKESLALAGLPLQPANYVSWISAGMLFVICVLGLFFLLRPEPGAAIAPAATYTLPTQITPFTVLNLLRRMEQDKRLSLPTDRRTELAQAIRALEQQYFGRDGESNGQSDLERLAREWVGRVL